jgi:hypothetical protein
MGAIPAAAKSHEPARPSAPARARPDAGEHGLASCPLAPAGNLATQRALGAQGAPLPPALRRQYEGFFAADLSAVRVHTGEPAQTAARALRANAFTVGDDVYFGRGRFAPESPAGQKLLAHEISHALQQSRAGRLSVQRQCETGPECAPPICGDPAAYALDVEPEEERRETERERTRPRRPGGPPPAGHGARAASVERVAVDLGVDLSDARGVYVSEDLASGGASMLCRDFEGWGAAYRIITFAPDDWCIFVPPAEEANAAALLADPAADPVGGMPRFQWETHFRQLLLHERGHIDYETHTHAALAGTACTRDTEIAPGFPVSYYLSELAATMAEFPPLLQAIRPRVGSYAEILAALRTSYSHQVFNCHESIRGVLTALRCHCSCADVDAYVRDTFAFTTRDWSESERGIFLDMIRSRFPSVGWPRE